MGAAAQARPGTAARTAVLVSSDLSFRKRVREALTDLRWQVREAEGGAETLACLDDSPAETVVLDSWLPDLEVREFVAEFERLLLRSPKLRGAHMDRAVIWIPNYLTKNRIGMSY